MGTKDNSQETKLRANRDLRIQGRQANGSWEIMYVKHVSALIDMLKL